MDKIIDRYRGFRAELAVAETFEEIKSIENRAAAAADFARREGIGTTEQNEWGRFRTKVTKKKGAWLKKYFPHGVKKKFKSSDKANSSMKDEGITPDESSDARLVLDDHYKNLESEKGGDRKTEKFQSSTDLTTEKQQAEQDIGKSRETIKTKSF